MSLIDIFIVLALAGGLANGLRIGAVRQITSLVGVLLAFLIAIQWMDPVGRLLADSLTLADDLGSLVGFVALFLGVQVAVSLLTRVLEGLFDVLSLTVVNRMIGGLLGAFKSALLLSVLFVVMAAVELPDAQTRQESRFYAYVAPALPYTWNTASDMFPRLKRLSDQFGDRIDDHLEGRDLPPLPTTAPSN